MPKLTKEELRKLGWVQTKNYTHSGEGYIYQLHLEDDSMFWEMEYNPDNNRTKIEKWVKEEENGYTPNTVLECKIHSVEELVTEMKWLQIPIDNETN